MYPIPLRNLAAVALVLAVMLALHGPSSADDLTICPRPSTGNALLTVHVPDDAKVFVNDHATGSTGRRRQYLSLDLLPGRLYPFHVRAELTRDGRTQQQTKLVHLRAGQSHRLAFDFGDLQRQALAGRDPRARTKLLQREGGGRSTESAVAKGLQWLAARQQPAGNWTLQVSLFEGDPSEPVSERSDVAATALALLPLLGAGQTHMTGRYRSQVGNGLAWLMQQQQPDGDLRGSSTEKSAMYAHGMATIVLCEALAMTDHDVLREPAQKAVDFIVRAQHPGGGWRYNPGEAGDTSVLGWQLMALQSAKNAKLKVPQATLDGASKFLDGVQTDGGSQYRYQVSKAPTHVMTAEGLLCRMYLGWKKDDPRLVRGVRDLVQNHLPDPDRPDVYYWYYGTQLLYQVGGDEWTAWNDRMRKILIESQETEGGRAGSWAPRGQRASEGGRLYMTTLAICMLEVYYRYAPLFRPLDAD